jgi:hypothetical protein
MEPADSIGRLGFRRWYERQLIQCHLWLVSCFLSLIMTIACMEMYSLRTGNTRAALYAILIGAGALIGIFSWGRYKRIMLAAEGYGDHSTCNDCGTYGRFDIVATGLRASQIGTWLQVKCRKCGGEWRMP